MFELLWVLGALDSSYRPSSWATCLNFGTVEMSYLAKVMNILSGSERRIVFFIVVAIAVDLSYNCSQNRRKLPLKGVQYNLLSSSSRGVWVLNSVIRASFKVVHSLYIPSCEIFSASPTI